jgi:hypothetical protein
MGQFFCGNGKRWIRIFAILIFCTALLGPSHTLGANGSGLSLTLYINQAAHPNFQYVLGTPVKLVMVMKNASGWSVNTERGFSQVELPRSLVVTDPGGTRYSYGEATQALTPPPPVFWKGLATAPADILPTGWVRSVTIPDLADVFPMTTPGWYTIEAHQPFIRFPWVIQDEQLGNLGVLNDPQKWEGTIDSNKIQIYLAPGEGAQLKVRVLEAGAQTETPLPQIPVRVFEGVIPDEGLPTAWGQAEKVLSGTTAPDGWVVWKSGVSCNPKNDYTAIAYYQDEYRKVSFETGASGWGSGCSGILERQIVFGETPAPFPPLSAFSALALNSVWIKAGAVIKSGHIGVMDVSPGLWLDSGVEVSIGLDARAEDGVRIYGDSVKLWRWASVDGIYYNHLENHGTIRGEAVTPLSLPLPVELPPFPEITPGNKNVNVKMRKTTTLNPGKYRDVSIGIQGTLKLKQGVYHFRNLNLGALSQLVCLGPGPTEIRIKQRMYPGLKAKIGPSPQSGLSAKDVVFYIQGANGNLRNLFSYPRAADIGLLNEVKANIYAPNGTISIDAGSQVQGSFIAQGVVVGMTAKVNLDSAF